MSASYGYNGDGLRVSKTVSSTTTDYTWDSTGLGQVISDGSDYVWGLGLISQIGSGTPTYAHSDGLGSTRLLTDSSGSVVGTQQYDAFGSTRSQTGTQLPFTYTGEQVDPESGLVYLRNRYLDPSTGRFLTPDPLGFVGSGVNLYAYVGNSPIVGADPSGLDGEPPDGGSNETLWSGLLEGITYEHAPPELIPYDWESGLETGATPEGPTDRGAGTEQRFYRGARGNAAPDFTPRSQDYKVDKETGTVRSTHGVSVYDNPQRLKDRGFTPHEVNQASVPNELTIIQRGNDPSHYEIVPAPGASLTPGEYAGFLSRIICY